jgi:hypothetical protein
MRKAYLIAAPLALLAMPVMAQSASSTGTVTINGAVSSRCLFTLPGGTITIPELSVQGSGSNAGKLDAGTVNGQTRTLQGWCNGTPSNMTVEAFPLLNTSFAPAAPTGFDKRIDYTATAAANSQTANDTSVTAGVGAPASVNLFTGDVVVTLSAASSPTSGLLVAGNYSGYVEVTLSPAIGL